MVDIEWPGQPERPTLRRALRHALRRQAPDLRVLAEDFLAESSSIDLLAVGYEGELVSIRIGDAEQDGLLLTRALADLTWLRPRARDLLKLAPGLGIEESADPRAMILCPRFKTETRSAADNFPEGELELFEYRCLRQQGQLALLLEPCKPGLMPHLGAPRVAVAAAGDPNDPGELDRGAPVRARPARRSQPHQPHHSRDAHGQRLTDPPSASAFRTGLTEADLQSGREPRHEEVG